MGRYHADEPGGIATPSDNPRPDIACSYEDGVRELNVDPQFSIAGVIDNGACWDSDGESYTVEKTATGIGPGNVLGL